MAENPTTRVVSEQKLSDYWRGIFVDPTKPPYNVTFDGSTTNVTANQAALQACLDAGGFITLPAGTIVIDGDLNIGSHTFVSGRGEGLTKIKIRDGAGWNARGIYVRQGSTQSGISHLTVDGNQPNRVLTGGSGGIYGTNISVINSTYVWIEHVASINAVQHCFDITTPSYGNAGDGAVIPNPSEYVWVTDCYADQHGDDGFTTHGSGRIWFTRCVAKGTWWKTLTTYTNANGFEIDDYSYLVTLTDCHAEDNAHGYEIKAHGNMSAAMNVRLLNCTASRNQVNFSMRHIGHHNATDPYSLTAKNVQLTNCSSWYPVKVFTGTGTGTSDSGLDATQNTADVSALRIGAYRGVTITNFHAYGDPTYSYVGTNPIVFEYRCEDIILDGYHIEGFTTADSDIYAKGGAQPAKNITVLNGTHRDSAANGLVMGSAANTYVDNLTFNRTVAGSANNIAVQVFGNNKVGNVRFETPFNYPFNVSGTYYSTYRSPAPTNVTIAAPA